MRSLTPAERRSLRAKAHRLHAVVSVGQQGLTPGVLHEIDVSLLAHELIKVRVFDADRDAREAVLARICDELDAAPVQHIGKLLVVWRPAPEPSREASERMRAASKKAAPPRFDRRRRSRRNASRSPTPTPLGAAKSTPQVRRPREPTARVPVRPPRERRRPISPVSLPPEGRKRPRGR